MLLVPISQSPAENAIFPDDHALQEILGFTIQYFGEIGYTPPWIGYMAKVDGDFVGTGAFKGGPVNNAVEIAYSIFPEFRSKGYGSQVCEKLVELASSHDAGVEIMARTLPEENHSTRILTKNRFKLQGLVNDPEDGDVWEWHYQK